MTRSALFVALALLTASCGGEAARPRAPGAGGGEGGSGGDGGEGGSGAGGRGGTGGTPTRRDGSAGTGGADAGAGDSRGASPDAAAEAGPPASADCAAAGPGSLFCNTLRELPRTIKETGLFPMAPDFGQRPAGLREYAPDPPLWSNGLEKQRFLLIPAGTKIDNGSKRWGFPVGTVLIKTFFDEGGAGGGRRPVETRFIRRVDGADAFVEYDYAVYQWNAQGTDATRLDIEGKRTPVMVTVKALNGGQPFAHDIPSRADCLECHEKNGKVAQTFIGFDETRLDGALPGGPANQLEAFAAAGLFTAAPAKPPAITDADPRLRRIKRFVFGNCVHCHNGDRIVDLHPDKLIENTVGKPVDASGVTPPAGWLRVVPGQPERSVLFVETRRTQLPTGLKPMPPVGVALPEPDALVDLRVWIMGLR
jgi:hypothetical protein